MSELTRYQRIVQRMAEQRIDEVVLLEIVGAAPHPVVILHASDAGLLTVDHDDLAATTLHMWADVLGIADGPGVRYGFTTHADGIRRYEPLKEEA